MQSKATIVVVDDDPVQLSIVVNILGEKYKCVPLSSGEHALKYFSKNTADLILLDYNMPGLNGVDVMKRLHNDVNTENIPVIFLTGVDDEEGEAAALRLGASDYILKPIRPAVLMSRVKNQLELYEHRVKLQNLVEEQMYDIQRANEMLKRREDNTLNLLARITDLRDEDTGTHIIRTTEYTRILVEGILQNPQPGYEFTKDEAQSIIKCAKLHDLGKIAIPDDVLLKPARLTPEEFEIIKKHPVYGEKFFSEFIKKDDADPFLEVAREITYSHHEKWDGSGYPQGLSGQDIPLSGRIVAIADVYDALTSDRPYKKAFTHEKAAQIIIEDSGKHFDPYLVEIFKENQDKFVEISKLRDPTDNLNAWE
jgi:putative two-component system response regulator